MGAHKEITFYERCRIQQLLEEDKGSNEIARELRRSYNGIRREITINGGRKLYAAGKANEEAKRKRKEVNAKRSKTGRRIMEESKSLIHRIEALEMQIQLLTKILRENVKNRENEGS